MTTKAPPPITKAPPPREIPARNIFTIPPWREPDPCCSTPAAPPAASQGRNTTTHVQSAQSAASSSSGPVPVVKTSSVPKAPLTDQSSCASELLMGKDGTGILQCVFTETIRRDIAKHSDPNRNQYILEYLNARNERGEPMGPQKDLGDYTNKEKLSQALHEFILTDIGMRDARQVNLTEYNVAILYLMAHSPQLFLWTRELLKRHRANRDEQMLITKHSAYELLFSYGRRLVSFFRHRGGCHNSHASLLGLSQVDCRCESRFLTFRSASLSAVLLTSMPNIRLSII